MTDSSAQKVNCVVEKLIRGAGRKHTLLTAPQLDIRKPNLHGTKQEFEAEKSAVEDSLKSLQQFRDKLDELVLLSSRASASSNFDFFNELSAEIGRRPPENASDLALANIGMADTYDVTMKLLRCAQNTLRNRLAELDSQERDFWNEQGRPPDHHARIIALRLARIFAQEYGRIPSWGTSSQGGHPSTDYARAVQEIFEILGIKTKFKTPAKWAVEYLKSKDIQDHNSQPPTKIKYRK